jgi:hypothetical protein
MGSSSAVMAQTRMLCLQDAVSGQTGRWLMVTGFGHPGVYLHLSYRFLLSTQVPFSESSLLGSAALAGRHVSYL